MPSIRSRLEATANLLCHASIELECILQLALAAHYDTKWTDAIRHAFRQTRETQQRVGNIATCLHPTAPITPHKEP